MTIVRRLGVDDVPAALAALSNDIDTATALTPRELRAALLRAAAAQGSIAKMVLSHDRRILALALVELPENAQARLEVLWVRPDVRRRHLGRALLASFGPSWRRRRVVATVPPGADQHVAETFLKNFSFKPTSRAHVLLARPVNTKVGRTSLLAPPVLRAT